MVEIVFEIFIGRRVLDDAKWTVENLAPVDLRVLVWDCDLVTFEFVKNQTVVATFRLSWDNYLDFADQIVDWFFDAGTTMRFMSPLDKGLQIECMAHADYTASIIFGIERFDFAFSVARADMLAMMDTVSMVVEKLVPDEVDPAIMADMDPDRQIH